MFCNIGIPVHLAVCTSKFWIKCNIPLVCYPPYPPDLASSDICLFFKLKSTQKGKSITQSMTWELDIPKDAYQKCSNKLQVHCNHCVKSGDCIV